MHEELWGHSVNNAGHRHGLTDHLRGTAARAAGFGEVFGAGELAEYLGLVHDVGKGACAWQDGLLRAEATGGRVVDAGNRSIDHKAAGAWLSVRKAKLGPFALAVLGHHGGLANPAELTRVLNLADGTAGSRVQEAIDKVAALIPAILGDRSSAVPAWFRSGQDSCANELLVRMVFSALVDADFLDTEEHFVGQPRQAMSSLALMADMFEKARADYLADAEPSPVDTVRAEIYEQAVAAADGPRGVFPFPAPTGGGKTIAAGGFAAHHAARHGLRRVVVAVPYTSITEQNARVYRKLFGAQHVLEHHSAVDLHEATPDRRWQRLAAENWDAPVVVTTTVRLFESLFSNKPSAMRKLHRLAGSVIVLDEVQALPDAMLPPILSALRGLTEFFGASVLLSSATQPAFFGLRAFQGLNPRPVIARPQPLYDRLRRVTYRWWCDPKPTLMEVAEEAADEHQVLVIVNTTGDAAGLHRCLEEVRLETGPVLHLSTRMAGAHRREVLGQIRGLLAEGQPVAVVSTQLVEAGVDLDFPAVYRACAPAEALQQAAGRANRNGRLPRGRVVVFDPADGSMKGPRLVYGAALDVSRSYFGPAESGLADPDDLSTLEAYYRVRYGVKDIDSSGPGQQIEEYRKDLDFPEVAARFRMIDEQTVPVLVPFGDDGEREDLRRRLLAPGVLEPWVLRRIQPYLATLPRQLARRMTGEGMATELIDGLYEWHGEYHERRGIDPEALSTEDYVW